MKPPPKSVTNEFAWSYTLRKLEALGKLDEQGDPMHYGAAMAIYKNVVKKYSDSGEGLPVLEDRTQYSIAREDIVALDGVRWVIARDTAFGANDDTQQRMWFDAGVRVRDDRHNGMKLATVRFRWCVEAIGESRRQFAMIPVESALWLARGQEDIAAWVRETTEEGLERLDDAITNAEAGVEIGGVVYENRLTREALIGARDELQKGVAAAT